MTDKEERLIRDAMKYGLIFVLAISAPIWVPIVALGAFICFPIYLVYLLVDEFTEYDKECNDHKIDKGNADNDEI